MIWKILHSNRNSLKQKINIHNSGSFFSFFLLRYFFKMFAVLCLFFAILRVFFLFIPNIPLFFKVNLWKIAYFYEGIKLNMFVAYHMLMLWFFYLLMLSSPHLFIAMEFSFEHKHKHKHKQKRFNKHFFVVWFYMSLCIMYYVEVETTYLCI